MHKSFTFVCREICFIIFCTKQKENKNNTFLNYTVQMKANEQYTLCFGSVYFPITQDGSLEKRKESPGYLFRTGLLTVCGCGRGKLHGIKP